MGEQSEKIMKGSEHFKKSIEIYLHNRAVREPLFAETMKKETKNIDDCIIYILNEVQKTGQNGFTDKEIFQMASHYYDEDNIEIGNRNISGRVVVNHTVELTEEEIQQAKDNALQQIISSEKQRLTKKSTVPQKKDDDEQQQLSMF